MAAINFYSQSDFGVPCRNTVFYGANSTKCFGLVIWNSLSNDLRNICNFDLSKTMMVNDDNTEMKTS